MSKKTTVAVPCTTNPAAEVAPVDASVEENLAETERMLQGARQRWPDLRRLHGAQRASPTARATFNLLGAMGALLDVLSTPPSETPDASPKFTAAHKRWERLRSLFDGVGEQDGGVDPERFEVEHLQREIATMRACQSIADTLDAMARDFRDHAFATGESLAKPVERSLDFARSLSRNGYSSEMAPVMNALRALTASARRATTEAEGEGREDDTAGDAKPASDKPTA
ncbi:MAG: hypothetical protein R3A52_25155 [Polyangiales bacterium]